MANMLTLAAYERARRALRGACELHCANAQMDFESDTTIKNQDYRRDIRGMPNQAKVYSQAPNLPLG